jgi:hypothetical protein
MSMFNRLKNFFKGEDNGDDFVTLTTDVQLSTIARWYVYDTGVGNENEVAEAIGLTPVSEEGDRKEKEDSEARVERLEPLFSFIDYMSTVAADSVVSMQLKHMKIEHPEHATEKETEIIFSLYKSLSMASLIGAFSSAIELGIVSLDAVSSNVIDIDKDDDYE